MVYYVDLSIHKTLSYYIVGSILLHSIYIYIYNDTTYCDELIYVNEDNARCRV